MKNYTIVFDNQCAVCSIGVKTLKQIGVMGDNNTLELNAFEQNKIACNVDPQKACNEMAVIDQETLEVRYGYDGYVNLVGLRSERLGRVMAKKWVKNLLNPFYVFFASNRRVIAPLQESETVCRPELRKDYRLFLIAFMALFAGTVTYFKGAILNGTNGFEFLNGWKLITITGLGWLLTGIFYREENKWDYWGNLSVIAGTAIFLQFLGLIGYYFIPDFYWVVGTMLASDFIMLWMHYRRVKLLGVSQKYTFRWWLILHLSATGLMALYYFN
jgi:hypothetical protein